MVQKAKKTKKQRKYGRNVKYCQYYAITHKRERNKLRRLNKHLAKFPDDNCARKAADGCKAIVG